MFLVNTSYNSNNSTYAPSFNNLNNLTAGNLQQIKDLLQSQSDLSSCLANCSNRGVCKLDLLKHVYYCECDDFFTGNLCQSDIRPCTRSNKCLNNGTCLNINLTLTSCQCPENGLYYGQYCENRRNLCENV